MLARRLAPALVTTFSLALGPVIVVLVLMLFPGSGSGSITPAESDKPVIQVLPRPTDASGRPVQADGQLPTTPTTTGSRG
jgi:hypothetical protein